MIRHRATAFHPFIGMDVPALVAMRARQRPAHPFLVWEPFEGKGEVLTYAAFHDLVGRLAAGLAARGLRPGDHLLVHLDNCLETILAWYACAEIGAVAGGDHGERLLRVARARSAHDDRHAPEG